jgi:predicted nuclease of predicted toxin-antitoxin system
MNEKLQVVIDESVDYLIVNKLKSTDFEVYAIIDELPSISDKEVLAIANKQNALLITEDKDFGELVFRFQLLHKGICWLEWCMQNLKKKLMQF